MITGEARTAPVSSMVVRSLALLVSILAALPATAAGRREPPPPPWIALHLSGYENDDDLEALAKELPDLAGRGVNVLILQVDYAFDFRSHPELRLSDRVITRAGAWSLVQACRARGIRLIPLFQSLSHQSWGPVTFPLLAKYPELDITPGAFPQNKGIYCREWDPMNPRVYEIVYSLVDEIVEAFDADALHVGMDEALLIGNEASPSTRGKDPAEVFARAVNDMYAHVVKRRGLEMLMWGDRLIDSRLYDGDSREASSIGTWPAIDRVPRDVIIADWHYDSRESYPSLPLFLSQGFRVLPTSYKDVEASRRLIEYGRSLKSRRVLGHLFTSWSKLKKPAEWPPLVANAPLLPRPAAPPDPAPWRR